MKNLKFLTALLVGAATIGFTSCEKGDENDPGTITYGDDFTVLVDGNDLILTSNLDATSTVLWTVYAGQVEIRSSQAVDTIQINGAGTWSVKLGANIGLGGDFVYSELKDFTIASNNAAAYSNELWTLLCGGFGNSKTYMLDVDNNGLSHYNVGPLTFADPDQAWYSIHDGGTVYDYNGDGIIGDDPTKVNVWVWGPKYADATWMFGLPGDDTENPQDDFGTMTFSLADGIPTVTVVHNTLTDRGTETSYFEMDVTNHLMKIYDAAPLHDTNRDGAVVDWGDLRITALDGTGLSLAALRDLTLSGENACMLIYNYCEKTYYDSHVPVVLVFDPENDGVPTLDVSPTTGLTGTWKINVETPFNWAYSRNSGTNVTGQLMNAWTTLADYLAVSWCGYTQAIHDSINTNNTTITFGASNAFTIQHGTAGTPETGTYALSGSNTILTFTGVTPSFVIGTQTITTGPVETTTATNQMRIIKLDAQNLYLAQRNTTPGKNEYSVVLLVKQ
jgi:hypothetical protein